MSRFSLILISQAFIIYYFLQLQTLNYKIESCIHLLSEPNMKMRLVAIGDDSHLVLFVRKVQHVREVLDEVFDDAPIGVAYASGAVEDEDDVRKAAHGARLICTCG